MPRRKYNVSIRFVEGDDGWVAINPESTLCRQVNTEQYDE